MNVSHLGRKQKETLRRMLKEGLVIRIVYDDPDEPREISLQDENGDNDYEILRPRFFESLGKRKIFECSEWQPRLFLMIQTWRVKNKAKEKLKSVL